ncbi:hypothetical protein BAUCODRAFT_29905 [Baudoinia panamericana UAMH 10762]|uniref:Uncharacterized protein n=1 Tax=Baudoinia panamericana (strain UAMH 10762) TaxID=717646 RepID=M2LXY4_BAUPA|nr:uncharacterized protein BAUCODRAFT_29905 [Baudoinia panamericana UAMH 10762]EMC99547.1 hypothetical protein BAUCODRAFT_29905 [Baudoinia panamericana UAMH 10762]
MTETLEDDFYLLCWTSYTGPPQMHDSSLSVLAAKKPLRYDANGTAKCLPSMHWRRRSC